VPEQPAPAASSRFTEPAMAEPPPMASARGAARFDAAAEASRPPTSAMPHEGAPRPALIDRVAPAPAAPHDSPAASPGSPPGGEPRVVPEAPRAAATPRTAPREREIDIESLVDQVQRRLLRRLAAERDRKGIAR
jgi:hypothetical protein